MYDMNVKWRWAVSMMIRKDIAGWAGRAKLLSNTVSKCNMFCGWCARKQLPGLPPKTYDVGFDREGVLRLLWSQIRSHSLQHYNVQSMRRIVFRKFHIIIITYHNGLPPRASKSELCIPAWELKYFKMKRLRTRWPRSISRSGGDWSKSEALRGYQAYRSVGTGTHLRRWTK